MRTVGTAVFNTIPWLAGWRRPTAWGLCACGLRPEGTVEQMARSPGYAFHGGTLSTVVVVAGRVMHGLSHVPMWMGVRCHAADVRTEEAAADMRGGVRALLSRDDARGTSLLDFLEWTDGDDARSLRLQLTRRQYKTFCGRARHCPLLSRSIASQDTEDTTCTHPPSAPTNVQRPAPSAQRRLSNSIKH